ncbi:MAG: class I SAM-dependent methyltransferase [Gemmatimonadota bacterium]
MTREGRYAPDAPERHRSWDERYGTDEYVYGTEPNEFVVEVADRIPDGRVLCLAEGEGRNAVYLAGLGYEVTAVDGSSVGLDKARRLAAERGVALETVHADLADFTIEPDTWEGIISIWAHLPRPLRTRLYGQAARGLVPGGVVALMAYTPAQLEYRTGGPPVAELLVDLASVREDLSGLDFEIARERVFEVHEGRLHHGMSAVVQVLARRSGAQDSKE